MAADERIEVSIYLKPRALSLNDTAEAATLPHSLRSPCLQHDIQLLSEFAREFGLAVVSVDPDRRLLRLSGTAAELEAGFGTQLSYYCDGKHRFRGRSGVLHLPANVLPVVQAVLGLDNRPMANPASIRSG